MCFKSLPSLTNITIHNNRLSDKADLSHISCLDISNTDVIEVLKKIPRLTSLTLGPNININSSVIPILPNLTSLTVTVDNLPLEIFASLTKLTKLHIAQPYCTISVNFDQMICNLINLTHLTILNNYSNTVSDAGISNLTNLIELNVIYSNITDNGLFKLIKLEKLLLSKKITDTGIQSLSNLMDLDIASNNNITNAGIEQLTGLVKLNLGYINFTRINEHGLNKLINLKELIGAFHGMEKRKPKKIVKVGIDLNALEMRGVKVS